MPSQDSTSPLHSKLNASISSIRDPVRPNIQILSHKIVPVRTDYIEKPKVGDSDERTSGDRPLGNKSEERASQQNVSSAGPARGASGEDKRTSQKKKQPMARGKKDSTAAARTLGKKDKKAAGKAADALTVGEDNQQLSVRNAWKRDMTRDPAVALGIITQDIVIANKMNRFDEPSDVDTESSSRDLQQDDGQSVHFDISLDNVRDQVALGALSPEQIPANKDPQFIKEIHDRRLHFFSHEVITFKFDEYYEQKFKRNMSVSSSATPEPEEASADGAGIANKVTTTSSNPSSTGASPNSPGGAMSNANQRYLQESLTPIDADLNAEQLLMAKYDNILFLSTSFTIFALYCSPSIGKKSNHLQILDSFTFSKEKVSRRLIPSVKHTRKINDFVSNLKSSLPAGSTSDKWKIIQDMQVQLSEKRLIVLFGGTLHAVDFSSICSNLQHRVFNCRGSLRCYKIQGKKSTDVEMMSINKENDKLIIVRSSLGKYFQLELVGSSYTQKGGTLELFVPGTILAIEYVGKYIVLSLSAQYLIVRDDGATLLNSLKRNKSTFPRWPRYLEDGSNMFSHLVSVIGSDKTVYTTAGQDDPTPPNPSLVGPDWSSTQVMDFYYPFVVNVQPSKVEFYNVYHDKRVDAFEFSNGYDILHDKRHIYTLAKKSNNTHQLLISTPVSFYDQKRYLLTNMDFVQVHPTSWPVGALDRIREKETLDLHEYHSSILMAELKKKHAAEKQKIEERQRELVKSIEMDPQFSNKPEALQRALESAKTQFDLDTQQLMNNYKEKKESIDKQLEWQMSQIHLLHGVLCLHQANCSSKMDKQKKAISEAFEHFKQSTIDVRFLRNYMQKAGEDKTLTQNLNSLKILSEIHPERMFLKPEQYDYLIEDKKYYAILRTSSYLRPIEGDISFHAVEEFVSFLERRKVMYKNDKSYFDRKLFAQDQVALKEVNVYLKPEKLIEFMDEFEKHLEQHPDIDDNDFSWIEKIVIYPTLERTREIYKDPEQEQHEDQNITPITETVKESKFGAQWVDLYLIFHYGSQTYRELQPSDSAIKKHVEILQSLTTLRPDDDVSSDVRGAYVALKMEEHAHFLYGYIKLEFTKRKAFFNRMSIILEMYRKKVAEHVLNDEAYSIDNYLLLLYGMLQHSERISVETRIKYSKQLKKITRGEQWNHWLLHVWGKLSQVEKSKSLDIRIPAIRAIFAIPQIYITWRITELTKENLGFTNEEALEEYLQMARKSRDQWIVEIEECVRDNWEAPCLDEHEMRQLKSLAGYDYFVDTESRYQDKSRKDVIIDACVYMLSRSHCILKRQILEIISSLVQKICNSTKKREMLEERKDLLDEAVELEKAKGVGAINENLRRSPMLFSNDRTKPPQPKFSSLRASIQGPDAPGSQSKSHIDDATDSIRGHIASIIAQRKLMLPLIQIFIHQNSKFTIGEVLRFLRNTHKLPYAFFSNNHSIHMQIEFLETIFSDKDLLEHVDMEFIDKYHSVEYQLAELYAKILGKFVVSGDKKNVLIATYRERFHLLVTSDSFNYKLDSGKKRDLLKILESFTQGDKNTGGSSGLKDDLIILHKSLRNHRKVVSIMFSGVTERTQYPEVFDQAESYCIQTFEEEKRSKGFTRSVGNRNTVNPYFTYMVDVASALVDKQSEDSKEDYKKYIVNLLTKRAREISLVDCLDFLPGDWSVQDLGFILKRNLRECEETIRNNQIRERSLTQTKIKKQFELAHLQSRYVMIDKDTECARSNPRENIGDVYGEALFVYPSVDIKKHCQQVVKGKNILDAYGNAFPRHINLGGQYRDMRKTPANVTQLAEENLIEHPTQLL
eukprot:CAMPEP_0117446568 /NCGR_PEP_ID=MMETSP0759-20121206/6412_1 /TAXON_ID=63605 /ORGANISM="Percolomonas cosmopolitus, Strain WS" /LENGTH=1815 /DNA_ID=CAMNT_0005238847 /DNA_START=195 /DNA_END=5642 /DNA_ORIENTATION=+